jgi:glycosyltransferase involved in cell wall biosynthesis
VDLEKMLQRDPVSDRGISVVIPACNNADTLAVVVSSVVAVLDRLSRGYEVILVNDESTDGTASVSEQLAAGNRRVRLVTHASRQGHGAALRSGFRLAKYPLVLQIGAANEYEASEIELMLRAIDQVDIVCGYRQQLPASVGRWRYWFYRKVLRMIFAVTVRDVDCVFRLYRRAALRRIPIQSSGRFANAEILAKATFMNMLIGEVPVAYRPGAVRVVVGSEGSKAHGSLFQEAARVFRHPQFRTSNTTPDTGGPVMQGSS